MEVDNYDGEDFHPSIEPMVIINSEEDEEENFFLKLQLCRKSDLKLCAQISQMEQIRNQLNLIKEVNFKTESPDLDSNSSRDSSTRSSQNSCTDNKELMSNIGPEISIFPVKKKPKPSFKIRLFDKKYGNEESKDDFFKDDEDVKDRVKQKIYTHVRTPGNRTPVRLISKEEAANTEEPYARRKSSPLEKCPICKKFFRRMKTHLVKHEILQNQEACAGLICEICNKAFNNHSNLLIHMRTHTGDKPYACEVCNKSFSQSCNLVNHMRIHTGEKPFKCPHCDRAFTQSGNLNNHIRLHTDEKPFKCHFCEKAFVQSGNLNSHIRNNHRFKDYPEMQNEAVIS